jgi:hypothetical protein
MIEKNGQRIVTLKLRHISRAFCGSHESTTKRKFVHINTDILYRNISSKGKYIMDKFILKFTSVVVVKYFMTLSNVLKSKMQRAKFIC